MAYQRTYSRNPRDRHTKVVIAWFAVPAPDKAGGGFFPAWEEGGKLHIDWYARGMDRDDAEQRAEARAIEAANRYTGDWDVRVRKGGEKLVRAAVARDSKRWKRKG